MGQSTPLWVTLFVGLAGGGLGALTTLAVGLLTRKSTVEANKHTRSTQDRALLLKACEWAQNEENATARRQGFAMLKALEETKGINPEDAMIVRRMMREVSGFTIESARALERSTGEEVDFVISDLALTDGSDD